MKITIFMGIIIFYIFTFMYSLFNKNNLSKLFDMNIVVKYDSYYIPTLIIFSLATLAISDVFLYAVLGFCVHLIVSVCVTTAKQQ